MHGDLATQPDKFGAHRGHFDAHGGNLVEDVILLAGDEFQGNGLRHGALFEQGQRLVGADLFDSIELRLVRVDRRPVVEFIFVERAGSPTSLACSSRMAPTTTGSRVRRSFIRSWSMVARGHFDPPISFQDAIRERLSTNGDNNGSREHERLRD